MKIRAVIKENKIRIQLFEKNFLVDEVLIREERALGEKILTYVDELLSRNGQSPGQVAFFEVVSDQKDCFTTTRIAKTVAKTWNYVQKEKNN